MTDVKNWSFLKSLFHLSIVFEEEQASKQNEAKRGAGAYGIIRQRTVPHPLPFNQSDHPTRKPEQNHPTKNLVSPHLAPEGFPPIIRRCVSAGSQRTTERLKKLSAQMQC